MYKSKVLVSFVVLIYILFVVILFSGDTEIAQNIRALLVPSITLLYFLCAKRKVIMFSLFLVLYSISDLMVLFTGYLSYEVDYYFGNSLYILAYVALLLKICKTVCVLDVFKNFKIHLLVLTVLNIYIAYVLQVIVDPYVSMTNEYFVELIYNIVMLLVLSAALLNYFYMDNKKALYLFIGALCIVFGEVISVAYLYVANENLLNFISTSLFMLGFYFFYQQSKLEYEDVKNLIIDEI